MTFIDIWDEPDDELDDWSHGSITDPETDEQYHVYLEDRKIVMRDYYAQDCKIDTTKEYQRPLSEEELLASEVGDDIIILSKDPLFLIDILCNIECILQLKISDEDTAIRSDGYGNFAEGLVKIPGEHETFKWTRNHQTECLFIDVPKIRTLINVVDTRLKVSSLVDGKNTYHGIRTAWSNTRWKPTMTVASLYQDINLAATSATRCAYFSTKLGGMGKPIPFGNVENYRFFFKSFKNGQYEVFLNSVVVQTAKFLTKLKKFGRATMPPLLEDLSYTSGQFHDWIKSRRLYTHKDNSFNAIIPEEVQEYMLASSHAGEESSGLLAALARHRKLVTEDVIISHLERDMTTSAMLSEETWIQFQKKKEELLSKWYGLSTGDLYQLGKLNEYFVEPEMGVSDEQLNEFNSFSTWKHGQAMRYLQNTKYYLREALDFCDARSHTHVNMPLSIEAFPGEEYFGISGIDELMMEFKYDLAIEWLRDGVGNMPTDLIEDDSPLIQNVINTCYRTSKGAIVVTGDYNTVVEPLLRERIPLIWLLPKHYLYLRERQEDLWNFLVGLAPTDGLFKWSIFLDTGSIETAELHPAEELPENWPKGRQRSQPGARPHPISYYTRNISKPTKAM